MLDVFLRFLEKQPSQMRFQAMERLGNRFKMKPLVVSPSGPLPRLFI